MVSKDLSSVLLRMAFSVLWCTHVYGKLEIKMEPTADFNAASSFGGLMFFKVVSPATNNQSCSTSCSSCATPGVGWTPPMECGGDITLDLSNHNQLEISFTAPSGYEIQIDGPDRTRIEFQAKVPCGPPGFGAFKHQSIEGTNFVPIVAGTSVAGLAYNAASSFVEIGRCNGCDKCEVYTRVQYDGPVSNARFSQISWTINYDSSNTLAGPQTYHYGTEFYCWIRGATLARRLQHAGEGQESASRELKAAFAGNEFKFVEVGEVVNTAQRFTLTSKHASHHNGERFTNHFWISRDLVHDSGRCLMLNCELSRQIWVSKADGTELSGPYRIGHNNPNDGTDFVSGNSTYYIETSTALHSQDGYRYGVGDEMYFQDPPPTTDKENKTDFANQSKTCSSRTTTFARCSCWGDPHCTLSFFGDSFDFMGLGLFRLAINLDFSFEVQAFQCRLGTSKTAVIAGVAIKVNGRRVSMVGDKIAVNGVPVNDSSRPVGLDIVGSPVAEMSLSSEDDCAHFYTMRNSLSVSPGSMHNLNIEVASANASLEGICGSTSSRKPIQLSEALFTFSELAELYNMCPESPKVDRRLHGVGRQMSSWVPWSSPNEACDLANIAYVTAAEKCKALETTATFYEACIYDYCGSGGDEAFVQNALASREREVARARLYPPASPVAGKGPQAEKDSAQAPVSQGLFIMLVIGFVAGVNSRQ